MKFLRFLIYLVVFLTFLCLLARFFLPSKFLVKREIVVNCPDSIAFSYVSDLSNYRYWNAWTNRVPKAKHSVIGNPKDVGGAYQWEGESIGKGMLSNEVVSPNRYLRQTLLFITPQREPQTSEMYFTSLNDNTKTQIVWTYTGENKNAFDRIFALFYERYVGSDFDKGLSNMKFILEHPATNTPN